MRIKKQQHSDREAQGSSGLIELQFMLHDFRQSVFHLFVISYSNLLLISSFRFLSILLFTLLFLSLIYKTILICLLWITMVSFIKSIFKGTSCLQRTILSINYGNDELHLCMKSWIDWLMLKDVCVLHVCHQVT